METQAFDIDAAAHSWEVPVQVEEPVDLPTDAAVASEASRESDVLPLRKLPELQAAKELKLSESRGVPLARAESFAERAKSYDVKVGDFGS